MRCNRCQKELKTEANFCPYCGEDLRDLDRTLAAEDVPAAYPPPDRYPSPLPYDEAEEEISDDEVYERSAEKKAFLIIESVLITLGVILILAILFVLGRDYLFPGNDTAETSASAVIHAVFSHLTP